jgi:hypothetical protein
MATPPNWMEEAGRFMKYWTDQQQTFLKMVSGTPEAFSFPGQQATNPLPGLVDGLQKVQDLWRTSLEQWIALVPKGVPLAGNVDALLKAMFDPSKWAEAGLGPIDRAIEHLVEGPSYATLWTIDREVLKAQKLRGEWARDLANWQVLMHGAWSEALKRFLKAVNEPGAAPINTWRELINLWIDVANETLVETHRKPEFLEAQRRLTRSSTECRLQERKIAEAYCEMHHIPTRTEVDEVQRSVYELRRDLRKLTRTLRDAQAAGLARVEPDRAPAPERASEPAPDPINTLGSA